MILAICQFGPFYPFHSPWWYDSCIPQGMAKTLDTLLETETLIRWDETDAPAVLWTSSARVRRDWESYDFKPIVATPGGGWRVEVPKDRISYKPLKKA